jgi:hypothetical protein
MLLQNHEYRYVSWPRIMSRRSLNVRQAEIGTKGKLRGFGSSPSIMMVPLIMARDLMTACATGAIGAFLSQVLPSFISHEQPERETATEDQNRSRYTVCAVIVQMINDTSLVQSLERTWPLSQGAARL